MDRPFVGQKPNQRALYFDGLNDRIVIPIGKNISTKFLRTIFGPSRKERTISGRNLIPECPAWDKVACDHGGYESKIAGLGITLGTNGFATYQHAHCLYSTTLAYPANLTNWNRFTTVCRDNRVELYLNEKVGKNGNQIEETEFYQK